MHETEPVLAAVADFYRSFDDIREHGEEYSMGFAGKSYAPL